MPRPSPARPTTSPTTPPSDRRGSGSAAARTPRPPRPPVPAPRPSPPRPRRRAPSAAASTPPVARSASPAASALAPGPPRRPLPRRQCPRARRQEGTHRQRPCRRHRRGVRPSRPWDFPTAPVPVATAPTPPAKAPGAAPDDPAGARACPSSARPRGPLLVGGGVAFVVAGGLGRGHGDAVRDPGLDRPRGGHADQPGRDPGAAGDTRPDDDADRRSRDRSARRVGRARDRDLERVEPARRRTAQQEPLRRLARIGVDRQGPGPVGGLGRGLTFAPAAVTRIQIWGGWQRDEPRYFGNHRPRNVTVSFDGGEPVPLALKDVLGAQRVDIPPELGIVGATRLRITIVDTYASRQDLGQGQPVEVGRRQRDTRCSASR